MATNKTDKVLNVPTLRFPGFTEEWQKMSIGSLASKVGSGSTPKGGSAIYEDNGHPFVRSQNIGNGFLLLDDIAYISDEIHNQQKNTEIKEQDVLLNITGASIGRCAIADSRIVGGNVNQHVCIIRAASLNPAFLSNFILSHRGQKQIESFQAGGNREGLNFEQVRSIRISVPQRKEQDKISSLLELIDERIALQSKLIDRLKSLMDGISSSLFHKSASMISLGSIVKIIKGQQINGSELLDAGKYPVMNGGITPSGYLNEFNTVVDTISISEGGNSCGYVRFNDTPIWSGGHCYTLHQVNEDISYRYLYHFLKHSEAEIMKLRIGSGLPNIQKKDLLSFPVAYYPISEQLKIARTLDAMEAKIFNEESLLHSLIKQKSYLLSAMFI